METLVVRAVFKFKGTNNDELKFKKGDLITVTQKETGGWWEGTLDGKTGWFPSNYVEEIQVGLEKDKDIPEEILAKNIDYRQQVIRDLLEKEQEFVSDLRSLLNQYLQPLHHADILQESEYLQLVGNIEELIEAHHRLNSSLEDVRRSSPRQQRLGQVFLAHGGSVRSSHLTYWANHPKAVCILEKHREKLNTWLDNCQTGGATDATPPGLMVLTTGLSRPFRHLERLAGAIQEVEQHLEDDHPDRGDTQRSIGFYKDVASAAARARRHKELELEILTGTVRGWEGENIDQMGDIIKMGCVTVHNASASVNKQDDRYLVLFPSTLLILSVSSRMSAFIYEGKLPLSGLTVTGPLEDNDTAKNAFEISGPLIESIVFSCSSIRECRDWVDSLQSEIRSSRQSAVFPGKLSVQPVPPPHVSLTPPYRDLTAWIRHLLETDKLTIKHIKALGESGGGGQHSKPGAPRLHRVECHIVPTAPTTEGDTSPVTVTGIPVIQSDPAKSLETSNPFGYIRYYDPHTPSDNLIMEDDDNLTFLVNTSARAPRPPGVSVIDYDNEDLNFLLPHSLLRSSSDSETERAICSMGVSQETEDGSSSPFYGASPQCEEGPWGRRLPNQDDASWGRLHPYDGDASRMCDVTQTRVVSDSCINARKLPNIHQSQSVPVLTRGEGRHLSDSEEDCSPPNWISCFPSPKSRRRKTSNVETTKNQSRCIRSVDKVPVKLEERSPLRFIDKTPSENSLNLPYCPPTRLSYADFTRSDLFKRQEKRVDSPRIQRKFSNTRLTSRSTKSKSQTPDSQIIVIPLDDLSQLDVYTTNVPPKEPVTNHFSQVVARIAPPVSPQPTPLAWTRPSPQHRCTCDSHRSSDSGLADISSYSHTETCPMSPTSQGASLQSICTSPASLQSVCVAPNDTHTPLHFQPSRPSRRRGTSLQSLTMPNLPNGHRITSAISEQTLESQHPVRQSQASYDGPSQRGAHQSADSAVSRHFGDSVQCDSMNLENQRSRSRTTIYEKSRESSLVSHASPSPIEFNPSQIYSACQPTHHFSGIYNYIHSNHQGANTSPCQSHYGVRDQHLGHTGYLRHGYSNLYPGNETYHIPFHSLSLDDLQRPVYREEGDQAFSCSDIPARVVVPPARDPPNSPPVYRTGLYAHWWLNTSLTTIKEEASMSTLL